ncbi:MAG: hypothetical protein L3J03_05745 [Desulfobacterales bacterium]|nr:hypothetical protein [Desulfobacterales bacterium]
MYSHRKGLPLLFLFFIAILAGGCSFHHEPVRHLASDAALIVPGQTSKQEVLAYLGEPDERRQAENGEEVWIYVQVTESFLRKAPYIGKRLGSEEYNVMNISFAGNIVTSCVYRLFNEEEYQPNGKKE